MATDFVLPELGENITSGDVLRVLVKPGDVIQQDQPVLELETDKATVEVPSTLAGRVQAVSVNEGDKVQVGQAILTVEDQGTGNGKQETGNGEQETRDGKQETGEREAAPERQSEPPPEPKASAPAAAPSPKASAAGGIVEVKIPELGENVTSGDVLRLLVKAGDTVERDQPVIELETEKATVEVPSSAAGRVQDIKINEGDTVKVGQVIFTVEAAEAGAPTRPAEKGQEPTPEAGKEAAPAAKPQERAPEPERPRAEVYDISRLVRQAPSHAEQAATEATPPRPNVPAAPSVRRLARELGVDVRDVSGSGPAGRVSRADVLAHAKEIITSAQPAMQPGGVAAPALPDFAKWGEIDRKTISGVRRKTAEHLSQAWSLIPSVTQGEKADITALENLRKRFARQVEQAGGKLTVTAILAKILAAAVKVFPQFSSSLDLAREELIYKKYVHVGIAVDTDRGLLVPVIRNVDAKNVTQVAVEIAQAAQRARDRKLTLAEMEGGCITITNLGGLGGTHFSPIVNWPEVAILGVSRAHMEPVWIDGAFQPRLMLPLSLSYDHRVIDGADAMRFLRWVADALEQPFLLTLQG